MPVSSTKENGWSSTFRNYLQAILYYWYQWKIIEAAGLCLEGGYVSQHLVSAILVVLSLTGWCWFTCGTKFVVLKLPPQLSCFSLQTLQIASFGSSRFTAKSFSTKTCWCARECGCLCHNVHDAFTGVLKPDLPVTDQAKNHWFWSFFQCNECNECNFCLGFLYSTHPYVFLCFFLSFTPVLCWCHLKVHLKHFFSTNNVTNITKRRCTSITNNNTADGVTLLGFFIMVSLLRSFILIIFSPSHLNFLVCFYTNLQLWTAHT